MSFLDIPEFIVSSEISICKGSYCDNVPERMINVEIQVINNQNTSSIQNVTQKSMKLSGKKYIYSSETLEKSQWPKLKISSSYIRESPSYRKSKEIQDDRNNVLQRSSKYIMLETSLTQSLQRLSQEELQKIATQSPRTRPLRPPCFNPYVATNRNLVIPTSDAPFHDLPHPLQSKTMNATSSNKQQSFSMNDPFIRFNNFADYSYISTYNQLNSKTHNIQKKKRSKAEMNSLSNTIAPESTKTLNQRFYPNSPATNTLELNIPHFKDDYSLISAEKTNEIQQSVPIIFRTEMRKKKNSSALNGRPYFTTCQEPLVKRPSTLKEISTNSSYII